MKRQKPKITIVIPTKNEEKTIEDIIDGVKPYADEILVVDGHSTDKTLEIARQKKVKIATDHGKGKGDAVRVGIEKAIGEIIVFVDADGSHELSDIPKLLEPIIKDKFDLVVASRMKGGSDELHGTIAEYIRLLGSQIITLVINHRFGVRLTDSQNGFRAIKKEVAKKIGLSENVTTIEQEMTIKCLKKGFRVGEISSHEYRRKFGKSRISLWHFSHRYVWCLLKNIF